ncbi:MAG TPA: hypothetical protein VKB34_12960, partial [Povalibacter sp.]|nr:hypothetical protein [Povalibacter sp.]
ITVLCVLVAAQFNVLAVALALSLSGVIVRAPLLAVLAVRKGNMSVANVFDGLKTVVVLAAITAAVVWAGRSLLHGLTSDILGLLAVGVISGAALVFVMRRPNPEHAARVEE